MRERAWEFDDGMQFELTGFAGGAHPDGAFSTVTCELTHPDGRVELLHYRLESREPGVPSEPEGGG